MPELADYSGPFNPQLSYKDFSKDVLIGLLVEYSREFIAFEGYWQDIIREKFDDQTANDWGSLVYLPHRYPRFSQAGMKKALNIQGNDVESLMKFYQFLVCFSAELFDYEVDLKNKNHAIVTVNKCLPLLSMEREGKGYEAIICPNLEASGFKIMAKEFNPAMECTVLKIPPRKDKSEIPVCVWEYKLSE